MNLPGLHDSDEYLETASRRSCSSSALLEAAVSSAVNHPNVVQTYDYRVFDPDVAVLSSAASFRSPLRVQSGLRTTICLVSIIFMVSKCYLRENAYQHNAKHLTESLQCIQAMASRRLLRPEWTNQAWAYVGFLPAMLCRSITRLGPCCTEVAQSDTGGWCKSLPSR